MEGKKFDLKEWVLENKEKIITAGCFVAVAAGGMVIGYKLKDAEMYRRLNLIKSERNKKALNAFGEMVLNGRVFLYKVFRSEQVPLKELPKAVDGMLKNIVPKGVKESLDRNIVGVYVITE